MVSGALLFDARQLFEQQNARADEALRSIVGQLPQAVATCVDAAGADMDPVRQAALMKVSPPSATPHGIPAECCSMKCSHCMIRCCRGCKRKGFIVHCCQNKEGSVVYTEGCLDALTLQSLFAVHTLTKPPDHTSNVQCPDSVPIGHSS